MYKVLSILHFSDERTNNGFLHDFSMVIGNGVGFTGNSYSLRGIDEISKDITKL